MTFAPTAARPIGTFAAVQDAETLQTAAARLPGRKRVRRPNPRSLEYLLSWGVRAINAEAAYRSGSTGAGVLVALVDTGTDNVQSDLAGNLSPDSIDLVRRAGSGLAARHGTQVGALIAAGLNGQGTMGVAYGANLLSIRADMEGGCAVNCAVRGAVLAEAIDYALAHGARIIAIPLVGKYALPSAEPAMRRAAAAGVVMVIAAGNDAQPEPAWPARYAADPELANAIVVAGASKPDGQFAEWSNRAGSTGGRYVLGPGERLLIDCDRRFCQQVSGTSYSVAFVAGALALLMERHPELSGPQAAALLLQRGTRRDRMTVSDPLQTGRGRIDLAPALRRRAAA